MESVGGVAQGGGNEEMKILIGKRGNESPMDGPAQWEPFLGGWSGT